MQSTSVVSVVAGGWSVNLVEHRRIPGHIIAVNDASFYLNASLDEIVSMDRLWTEYRWSWLKRRAVLTNLRRSAVQNLSTMGQEEWLNVFDCNHESVEFSNDWARLNGTNSGTCALNRAWQLRPKELYLFGFDMCLGPNGQRHWHPDYPYAYTTSAGKFRSWVKEFKIIAAQFKLIGTKVWNVSERSEISAFPRMQPNHLPRRAA